MKILKKLFPPRPPTGESTRPQATAGMGFSQLPGFTPPVPGTYGVYRRMSAHPTLALAKSVVTAPILAGSWSFEARRPDGQRMRRGTIGEGVQSDPLDRELRERSTFIGRQMGALRFPFLNEAVRALEFGWRPFEKVWDVVGGAVVLKGLKPLLPDFTFVQIDAAGKYAGIEQLGVQLPPDKAFLYTHDGEAGNLYGRSRHENARHAWWNWTQTDERTAQLTTKIAAIIPMVHYPLGQSRDASGAVRDNGDLADTILAGLGSGRGVKLPNLFANSDDPRLSAELAGQSSWVISFLEAASAATNLGGMTDRQRYYDALMFRAWLRPERVGLESQYGSRADAEQHSETSLTDSELIHSDLCDQLSRGPVDELLAFNFGEAARGSVFVSPAPLQQAKRDVMQQLLQAAWANPATLASFIAQTDMEAVFDEMSLPRSTAN